MFANGERERERDWFRHVKVNNASADRQVERKRETLRERERERERERCVFLFHFVSLFNLLWELVYIFQSFVSIFAKKI